MATAPPEVEARWHTWAEQTLGGSPTQVDAATKAALGAMARGAPQAEVVEMAKRAWATAEASAGSSQGRQPQPAQQGVAQPGGGISSASQVEASRGFVRGRVAGLQQRNEMWGRRYVTVWDFHITRDGDLPPVSVEMRGFSYEGSIANGDVVEVRGRARGNRILHVRRLENRTSNSTVRVKRGPHMATRVLGSAFKTIFFLIWLAVALTIAYVVLHKAGKI